MSCPFKTSCQTESHVAYISMEPCGLFHSKLWIFYHNSSLVFKSLCQIESFVSYRTMEFSFRATYQYGFVWIFVQYGFQYGYEFKSCPFKVILMSSWIFYHISHNVILFAVSFKATQVLSFQIQMSNWNFSCISQNEILLALSFKAMNFWKEFKFCFQI